MRRLTLLIGMLAVAVLVLAGSSASQNEQEGQPGDHQQNAATDGKSAAAVVASPVTTPTPEPKTENRGDEPWNYSDALAPITWSAWSLVLVGGIAAGVALYTLGAIRKQVEIGSETIKETQKEFAARYRPRLRVRNVEFKTPDLDVSNAEREYLIEITFHVVNYGESSASIVEAAALVQPDGVLPMKPAYGRALSFVGQIPDERLDSGQGVDIRTMGVAGRVLKIKQTNAPIWLVGFINYRGPLASVVYRTAFARGYREHDGRFVPEKDNPDYEYEE